MPVDLDEINPRLLRAIIATRMGILTDPLTDLFQSVAKADPNKIKPELAVELANRLNNTVLGFTHERITALENSPSFTDVIEGYDSVRAEYGNGEDLRSFMNKVVYDPMITTLLNATHMEVLPQYLENAMSLTRQNAFIPDEGAWYEAHKDDIARSTVVASQYFTQIAGIMTRELTEEESSSDWSLIATTVIRNVLG